MHRRAVFAVGPDQLKPGVKRQDHLASVQRLGQKDQDRALDGLKPAPISGEGLIGLGKAPERDSSQTIRFICEE